MSVMDPPQSSLSFPSSSSSSHDLIPRCKDLSNFLHKMPVNETAMANQLTCVLEDGSRVYLKRSVSRDIRNMEIMNKRGEVHTSGNLLSKSMDELLDEAKSLQIASMAATAQREDVLLKELHASSPDDRITDELLPHEMKQDSEEMEKMEQHMNQSRVLWVDKYSPKQFSQLLSPEKINREALKALKQWDKFVFESKKIKASELDANSPSHMSPIFNRKRNDGMRDYSDSDDDDLSADEARSDEEDFIRKPKASVNSRNEDHRPTQRVILLCGPPGTGKTTLAHVIARHCGYRPHEVNASDDRSAAAIKVTMEQAMHGRTLGTERRPNCIIMDEIDGIDGRAGVDALLSIIKCPLKQGKNKKNKAGVFPLTRPLICICNDQYSPSLKELRKLAQIFVFTPPSEMKLVQRLKNVCISEGLHVNNRALTTLSQAAGKDIRSAINTLQFASMRGRKELKRREASSGATSSSSFVSDISKILNSMILNGLKDEQRDIFVVWGEIFNLKAARIAASKKNKELGFERENMEINTPEDLKEKSLNNVTTMMHVIRSCEEFNDESLVTAGTFENYLKTRSHDPTFTKTQQVSDWLSFGDQLEYFNLKSGYGYTVGAYQSSVHGAVHTLCATENKMKMFWPSQSRNAYFRHQQLTNIVQCVIENLASSTISMTKQIFAMDVVALLADILSPKMDVQRGGSLVKLSREDIDELSKVGKIMKKFGLSFPKHNELASHNICYRCNQTGHYAHNCPTLLIGDAAVDNVIATLKNQVDPAIHQLLAYTVNSSNTDAALGRTDNLSDKENLTMRSQCRIVNLDMQKGIHAAEQMNKGQGHQLSSLAIEATPQKDVDDDGEDAPSSGQKRLLQNWDPSKPMTAEGIAAMNALKKSKGEPKGGRIDSFYAKKPTTVDQKAKLSGVKRDAPELEKKGDLYYKEHKIRFKFEPGFSAAVKRPAGIDEFL